MEGGLEVGVVLLRVSPNEVDDLAIAVSRLFLIAAGLVNHPEPIPAVMHIGEALEQIAGDLLGLVEPAFVDEVDGGVGRRRQLVLEIVEAVLGGGEAFGEFGVRRAFVAGRRDGCERALDLLVLGEAAALVFLAAATRAGIIASGFGHRGLQRDGIPCTGRCWRTPDSTICFWHSIVTWRRRRGRRDAHAAAGCCTRRGFAASRAGLRAASMKAMIGV